MVSHTNKEQWQSSVKLKCVCVLESLGQQSTGWVSCTDFILTSIVFINLTEFFILTYIVVPNIEEDTKFYYLYGDIQDSQ